MTADPESAVIIGCGFIGARLARRLLAAAPRRRVIGTTRSPRRAAELAASGIEPLLFDIDDIDDGERAAALADALRGARTVVLSVAPSAGGGDASVYGRGVARLLAAIAPGAIDRAVFTSSSAVYGQDDGSWVDEGSPAEPATANGRALREAERAFLDGAARLGHAGVALRLCGIWSAERGPQRLLERIAGAERADGDAWLNLVHADDIVEALVRIDAFDRAGAALPPILNLNDDAPTTRRRFYDPLLAAAGLPPVRWVDRPGPPSLGKRVRNSLAKTTLGLSLAYPGH